MAESPRRSGQQCSAVQAWQVPEHYCFLCGMWAQSRAKPTDVAGTGATLGLAHFPAYEPTVA
jgi:hypothetical protein